MDCGQRFEGDDYLAHSTCISEAEKYQGALYRPAKLKPGQKADPQERWGAAIASAHHKASAAGSSANPRATAALGQLLGQNSVPRKRTKFGNFLKNSLRLVDAAVVNEMFDLVFAANSEFTEAAKGEREAEKESRAKAAAAAAPPVDTAAVEAKKAAKAAKKLAKAEAKAAKKEAKASKKRKAEKPAEVDEKAAKRARKAAKKAAKKMAKA